MEDRGTVEEFYLALGDRRRIPERPNRGGCLYHKFDDYVAEKARDLGVPVAAYNEFLDSLSRKERGFFVEAIQ